MRVGLRVTVAPQDGDTRDKPSSSSVVSSELSSIEEEVMDQLINLKVTSDVRRQSAESVEVVLEDIAETSGQVSEQEDGEPPDLNIKSLNRFRKVSVIKRGAPGAVGGNVKSNIQRKKADDAPPDGWGYFGKDDKRRHSADVGQALVNDKTSKRLSLPHSSSLAAFFDFLRIKGDSRKQEKHKFMYTKRGSSGSLQDGDQSGHSSTISATPSPKEEHKSFASLLRRPKKDKNKPSNNPLLRASASIDTVQKHKNRSRKVHSIGVDDTSLIVDEHGYLKPPPFGQDLFMSDSDSDDANDNVSVVTGHEHPYSIKMSHVRDSLRERGSGEDITMPMDVDLNIDNQAVDVQFVLRQNKKVARKSSFEDNLKRPKKSKRSPIISFFRGGKTKSDGSRGGSPTQGRLFGHNLSDVCEESELCKPIKDLLQYLFQHGPFISGVFRKSGSHKRIQEIRSQMDQGEDVQWDQEPVVVACSILKDFLRSLPDCLFLCDMFPQWAHCLNIQDENEQKQEVIRLLARLPPAHTHLLRHLVCVLYHILAHTEQNQMNAQNLAVCIAPSLLWQQAAVATGNALHDTVQQAEETEKARRLVQYLLEHVEQVFGQEVTTLFGPPPAVCVRHGKARQDSSTDSDSMHSMLSAQENTGAGRQDNSSPDDRDSYYTEPEPSPQLLLKAHLSPTNLSCDSGLTNSDPRLYDDVPDEVVASMDRQRKPSMTRSMSHQDQVCRPSHDPGTFSHSCDGTLDSMHCLSQPQPIPPPRSKKGRGRQGCSPSDTDEEVRGQPIRSPTTPNFVPHPVPMLRHSSSALTVQDFRKQMRTAQGSSKRDSLGGYLGSVEEDQDPPQGEDARCRGAPAHSLQALPPQTRDIGILQKSESGTRLYVRDDSMTLTESEVAVARHRVLQNRKSCPPNVAEVQAMFEQAKANVYIQQHEQCVPTKGSHHSRPDTSRSHGAPTTTANTSRTSDTSRVLFQVSSLEDSDDTDSVLSNFTYMVPVTKDNSLSYNACKSKTPVCKRTLVKSKSLEPPAETPRRSGDEGRLRQRPAQLITSMSCDMQSPRGKGLTRSDAVEVTSPPAYSRESLYKKGMTAKGADIFPSHARFYHQSVDQASKLNMFEEGGRSSSMPRDSPSSQSSHKAQVKVDPAIRLKSATSIERSASESSLHEQLTSDWHRPRHPPSYQEAIQRKAHQQSSACITPQEIESQRHKNAVAKKLYEESLRKLQDEEKMSAASPSQAHEAPALRERASSIDTTVSPRRLAQSRQQPSQKSPPSYEHACQRAEQIREQKKERTPPRYSSRREVEPAFSTPSQHSSTPVANEQTGTIVKRGSDELIERLATKDNVSSSREGTPTRSEGSSREGSMSRKHRRRSKERRIGHRNSDTKLSVASKAGRMNNTNLNRSKSDSSEHIHRSYKFKDLTTGDNKENVSNEDLHGDAHTIEKLEKLVLTRKPSFDKQEKMAKDLENEKMRRQKMSRSTENISYKLLAENISDQGTDSTRQNERRVSLTRSVKNRSWHKDLADQYSGEAPQPADTVAKYSYKSCVEQCHPTQDKEAPRQRKWMPPVHPTKDLVITYARESSKTISPVRRVQSNASDLSNHKSQENKQQDFGNRGRSHSEAPPPAPTDSSESQRTSSEVCAQNSAKLHETIADSAENSSEQSLGLSWSVSQLRNLYGGGSKPSVQSQPKLNTDSTAQGYYAKELPRGQHQTAGSLPRAQHSRQGPKQWERTNPSAEEAYV